MFIRPDAEVQFGELRIFFAMLLGLAILFSLLFVMIITLHIVRPITRLSKATQDIAKGRFNVKVETRRQDEIGQLAHQFNRMSQELGRSDKAKQEFVANVSHEIESPLTSIQGFAHTLKDNTLSGEQQQHYLSIIEDESKRLSMLSKQLLTLSSLDHAGEALRIENYDLRAQLRAVIQVLEWKLTQKELAIKLSVPELHIQGEQELLYQVWMNLISNAIKYTPHGGEISVSAIVEHEKYVIKIMDNGQGIASEHLAHIFDRFYKVDQVRSREGNEDNSTGLGLAIVQKIVHLHKGTVEVWSKEGEGTTFVVTLPILLLTQL
jgi:signal transduction histidine kinase